MSGTRLTLIVSVWLRDGDVAGFEAFESKVAKIQAKHGGRIERAIRLTPRDSDEQPFELHIVSFPDEGSLAAYRADEAMQALGPERERLIARTVIVEGRDVPPY